MATCHLILSPLVSVAENPPESRCIYTYVKSDFGLNPISDYPITDLWRKGPIFLILTAASANRNVHRYVYIPKGTENTAPHGHGFAA